jgi:hypothetical protein
MLVTSIGGSERVAVICWYSFFETRILSDHRNIPGNRTRAFTRETSGISALKGIPPGKVAPFRRIELMFLFLMIPNVQCKYYI